MPSEHWLKVEQLYHAALEREEEQRAAYLKEACPGDDALRREVESLLAETKNTGFLETPALQVAARMLAEKEPESYLPGQHLGFYTILSLLGAGGMGVVYRARDSKLGREVAIKVLPTAFVHDPDRLSRFQREARMLASLNHPNIATIYGLERSGGVDFLVMELIAGQTLAQRLGAGPLATEEALAISRQIAEALEAAHEKGVIHRDLKPANVKVTPEGRVKVLDFGLAKALAADDGLDLSQAPTVTDLRTAEGRIVGTPAYMSPEQARGNPVDKRTDVWAFGCVLYELLSKKRAFPGETSPDTIAAVLEREPDWQALPLSTPPRVRGLLRRCLQKDAQRRLRDLGDARLDLEVNDTRTHSARWLVVAGATVAALAVGSYLYFHRTPKLTEKDSIVLADFENTTGDSVFDGTLRQGLSVQLEQTPFFRIISGDQIAQTLRLMEQPPDARLTPDLARQVCARVGAKAEVEGTIAALDSQYVLGLNAVSCETGEALAQEQATADGKEKVLTALGDASANLRSKLGESRASLEAYDVPLEQATTSSLEALQAYSLGRKANTGGGDEAAVPLFRRSIGLDPNFAMAYGALGTSYYNLGEFSLGAENTRKAYELRDRASEREKFYIESHYHSLVTGNLEKARQIYALWAQAYPRDDVAHRDLGVTYQSLGQFEKVLAEFREALRIEPVSGVNYDNLVDGYLYLNRIGEAEATVKEAQAKRLDSPLLSISLYQLAFVQNDAGGMVQQVARSASQPGVEDVLLASEADTAAYSGRLAKARELSRQAVASAERADEPETAADYEADAALREALFGNPTEARVHAGAALALSTGRDVWYGAALALALAGDTARVQPQVDDFAKRFPEDTIVQFNYLPTLRAHIALSRNDAFKAIELLQTSTPYELGLPDPSFNFVSLYPLWARAEAYLAVHRGNEAAAEFRKILDHPGLVLNQPIGALAHLGLGRAYASQGDTPKAKVAYQDFLTLWKDADPDIPIVKQAKAEYAKLQ